MILEKSSLSFKERSIYGIEKIRKLLEIKEIGSKEGDEIKTRLRDFQAIFSLTEKSGSKGFNKIIEINEFIEQIGRTVKYYLLLDNIKKEKTELKEFLSLLEKKIYLEEFSLTDLELKTPSKESDFGFRIKKLSKNKKIHLGIILAISLILNISIFWGEIISEKYTFTTSLIGTSILFIVIYNNFLRDNLN